MNDSDIGRVLSAFQGAYPNTGPENGRAMQQTTSVWRNVLAPLDADLATRAAHVWISTQKFWPTPAEFNETIESLRRNDRASGREDRIIANSRCNGSGWMDKGEGLQPCPACNPWLYSLHQEGEISRIVQPPAGYVMPTPCRNIHLDDQPGAAWPVAMDALTRGYREHLLEQGYTDDEIEKRMIKKAASFNAFAKRDKIAEAEVADVDL